MSKCNHEKVFANWSYATNPPKTPWVCKKCGETGLHVPDNIDFQNTYESLLNEFKDKNKLK